MKVHMTFFDAKLITKVSRSEYYMYLVDLDVIFTNVSFVANSSSTMNLMDSRFHKQCDYVKFKL